MHSSLLQTLGAAFCAILAHLLQMGGGGMIAAHHSMLGDKTWVNPYVANDAFFCFDGEWNAGGGEHTADKTWTDLISGDTITLPSAVTVASNHVEIRSAVAFRLADTAPLADFTVEYVFSPYDTNTFRECLFESANNNYAWRYKKTGYVMDSWIQKGFNRDIWQVVAGKVVAIASTFEYKDSRLYATDYLNGQMVNEFWFGSNAPIALGGFQVGRVGGTSYTTYQDIYRAQVYSRALTAAEIAHNYAIDATRFSLPTS